ncbi:glycosyltransferase [Rubrivirga sp. IMCC45206]|uniref:glycosyltransferase n=1 Tax=Rubrivirga sp. IMCC45206 TaxID=3391614 RepID=UPI00398FFAE5
MALTAPPPRPTAGSGRPARAAPPTDAPPTVLLVHNVYQQPGGEDGVFEREGALLDAHGHRVLRYVLHNDAVEGMSRAALAARTLWSRTAHDEVRRIVEAEGVDVVHVHNTLPLASPSVFWGAHAGGAATVHTLHNYRMVCPGNLLLRDGRICHDCVGKTFAAPAVRHACYRDDRAATAAVAATTALHRALGTWATAVDRYIALSAFARDLFVEGGLPADRVAVKHNAPPTDPVPGPGGDYALFAGRLARGKGIEVLLEAWALDPSLPSLQVAGSGPLAPLVEAAAAGDPRINALGWQTADDMAALMGGAAMLVTPSTWYEGWPLVAVEAMGQGTPVVATDHGAFPEMVSDGDTGRLVPRGDAPALAAAIAEMMADPEALRAMRCRTIRRFEGRFSRAVNYTELRQIYADAIAQRAAA